MCSDGKSAYREMGYKPRKPEDLWESSPHNPKNKKQINPTDGIGFINDLIRF